MVDEHNNFSRHRNNARHRFNNKGLALLGIMESGDVIGSGANRFLQGRRCQVAGFVHLLFCGLEIAEHPACNSTLSLPLGQGVLPAPAEEVAA